MEFNKKDVFTLPNILTYLRIALVPVFIAFMFIDFMPNNIYWAFGVFLLASFTDIADGYIARKFSMVSDIGKILDPFADKFLQVSAIICLTVTGNIHYAFAIILFSKELYMIFGSLFMLRYKDKITIQANVYGKVAAAVYAVGMILAFFHNDFVELKVGFGEYTLDWMILTVASVLAIVAAVYYTADILSKLKKANSEEKENPNNDDSEKPEALSDDKSLSVVKDENNKKTENNENNDSLDSVNEIKTEENLNV